MPAVFGEVDLSNASIQPQLDRTIPTGLWTARAPVTGRVILFDSFEDPNTNQKWQELVSGGQNSTGERSWNRSYHGNSSFHQKVTLAGANQANSRTFWGPDRISAEIFYSFNDNLYNAVNGQALFFELRFFDGTNVQGFRFEHRFNFGQNTFWSNDFTGSKAQFDDWGVTTQHLRYNQAPYDRGVESSSRESWHHVKMIVDRSKNCYVGCYIDNHFVSLAGTPNPGSYSATNANYVFALPHNPIPINLGGLSNWGPVTDSSTGTVYKMKHWQCTLNLVLDTTPAVSHLYWDALTIRDETGVSFPNGI